VFIGYAEGAKAYRIYDPVSQRVHVSRDVVFDEGRGWDWVSPAAVTSEAAGSEFTVEFPWAEELPEAGSSASPSLSPPPHPASPGFSPVNVGEHAAEAEKPLAEEPVVEAEALL
jgi:hypothetical protein